MSVIVEKGAVESEAKHNVLTKYNKTLIIGILAKLVSHFPNYRSKWLKPGIPPIR